jgi:DNA polymerase III delta prime subunit
MNQSVAREKDFDMLWTEKYRPQTVQDCILPDRIKKDFLGFVSEKKFPNLLLTGGPGTGKTTIAKALCRDLGYDVIVINASDERNIDTVRTTIKNFASTTSLLGNKKAIILDEADGLNIASAQPALRAAMEEFHTVRFILTANYKNKIIPAIHSRTAVVEFNIKSDEKQIMMATFLKRVFEILTQESVKFDKQVVATLIKKLFPDNRRILNDLQKYSVTGEIDAGLLTSIQAVADADSLLKYLKEKDFAAIKTWVANNSDTDTATLFRAIYETFYTEVTPESVPELIIKLAQYQYNSAFVADQEINTLALLAEIMGSVEFK